MKNRLKLLVWLFALSGPLAQRQSVSVNGPDGKLQLTVSCPVSQRRSVLRRHLQWKANAGIFSLGDGDKCG